MANWCSFTMMLVGAPQQVELLTNQLAEAMENGSSPFHGYVVVYSVDRSSYPERSNGDKQVCITGSALHSCYAVFVEPDSVDTASEADMGTSLITYARELGISAEIFSREPAFCFAEHIVITPDTCTNEERSYEELTFIKDNGEYESFDEFKQKYDLPDSLSENDLEDGIYIEGGFDESTWTI